MYVCRIDIFALFSLGLPARKFAEKKAAKGFEPSSRPRMALLNNFLSKKGKLVYSFVLPSGSSRERLGLTGI
jgi:hypothetical protein